MGCFGFSDYFLLLISTCSTVDDNPPVRVFGFPLFNHLSLNLYRISCLQSLGTAHFVNLQLSPEEYKFFNEHSLDFFPSKWQNFLVRSAKKYGFSENLPYDYTVIERNFKPLESFYEVAEKRDEAFINNIERNMNSSKQDFAALITGGFHTDQIVDRLKNKNYAYIIFAPKFGSDNDEIYLSVLKEKGGAWLEKWREKKNKK